MVGVKPMDNVVPLPRRTASAKLTSASERHGATTSVQVCDLDETTDGEASTLPILAVGVEHLNRMAHRLVAAISGIRSAGGWASPDDLANLDSALDDCCDLLRIEIQQEQYMQALRDRVSRFVVPPDRQINGYW